MALRAQFRFPQQLVKALGCAGASQGKPALDRLAQLGLVKTRTQGSARPEMLTGPAEAARLRLAPATGATATLKQLPFKVVGIDGDPVKGHVAICIVCRALHG